ncbi:MAG: pyridoxal phosphate-dependent aminotransferase [Actinobacteria bacterium]|nr:pyridoxal phosphate-dependent aminotransferase [Actinomycetota bacterium]
MEVLEKAHELERSGRDVVHLEIGEPDFDTPEPVKEAVWRALSEGKTQYTHSLGVPQLREAIAGHYNERYGVEVSPDNVVVTSGTSPAMLLVFSALLNPGEEIILSDPCYACYPNILEFVGGVPRYVEVYEEDGFKYRPERIKEQLSPRVKGVMVNSPSNPTGIVLSAADMEEFTEAVGSAFIISDEIYHGLVYEGQEHSILEFTDKCFVLNGFSKLYAMTGWRLGYIISPPEFVRPLQKIQQNLLICANSFVQWAGISALTETGPHVKQMVETYEKRRQYILKRIKELGFGVSTDPTGAFYVFANAKRFTCEAYAFCLEVLENAGVALTPGIDFGSGGEGYVRFSYANSLSNIREGMGRLEEFLKERGGENGS